MTERVGKPRGRKKKAATRASMPIRPRTPPAPTPSQAGSAPQGVAAAVAAAATGSTSGPRVPGSPRRGGPVLPKTMLPSESRYPEDVERTITAIRHQYQPPTYHQPTHITPDALDLAFLMHYVKLNKGTRSYAPEIQWLNHLPRIHSKARKPAVKLALRAVSMAFYAKLHHDPSVLVDSWRWYSVSLNAQRVSLERRGDTIPDEEEVIVPLVLALYEIYVGTTASGAMAHLNAAAAIIKMRGPRNCRSGVVWPLFKGIRNADAHRAIVFGTPSVYSSTDWMTLPFEGMPRDAHQLLADIELKIPLCMELLGITGSLRVYFSTPIPPYVDIEPCRAKVQLLIDELDDWALQFPNLTNIANISKAAATNAAAVAAPPPSAAGLEPAAEYAGGEPPKPDSFIALIASNYVATRLTLYMLMHKMFTQCQYSSSTTSTTETSRSSIATLAPYTADEYFDMACDCAKAILHGASQIEQAGSVGFDMLRSIAPVVTVACIGPCDEQKAMAGAMMMRWAGKMGGLGKIFPAI